MQRLNTILLSTVCLVALASAPALAANSGVTAAVNQSAHGTAPGGAVRTIVIGDNVVTDEKIDTDGAGLVQILLPDGTTFTVGPNSSLTIDKFVYDPSANTAQVTASLARGVFRFIGGRTSKTEDGVTLNTPVGTVGIRGAVVDLSFYPKGKEIEAQIDLLFGNEVTLSGQGGVLQRLYQAGYSIIIGSDGKLKLVKTPPGSTSNIQQLLAGKPGQHGGSSDTPTDDQIAGSDTHKTNSDLPPDQNAPADFIPPDIAAIILATLDPSDPHNEAMQLADEGDDSGHSPQAFSSGTVTGFTEESSVSTLTTALRFRSNTSADDNYFNVVQGEGLYVESGKITADDPTDLTDGGQIAFAFNGDSSGTVTATSLDQSPFAAPASDSQVDLTNDSSSCDCAFLHWGEWRMDFNTPDEAPLSANGYWVAGNVNDDLFNTVYPKLSTGSGIEAHYHGFAEGTVVDSSDGLAVRDASGTMDMTYHLGSRTGEMNINDFDGHDFSTGVVGLSSGAASFGGHSEVDGDVLDVTGAFASDGFNLAAGVMGNFGATSGSHWSASGIFAGARDTTE